MQEHIPHYRLPFFNRLRELCVEKGIGLDVIYSSRTDVVAIPSELMWARGVKASRVGGFIIQRLPRSVWQADLIIVSQEIKYLMTHVLMVWCRLTGRKIAMWGHGKDFQSDDDDSVKNRIRRWVSKRVDWWFAYNDLSVEVVRQFGFPSDKVTNVQNSVDVRKIINTRDSVTSGQLQALKEKLGIISDNVAIFTGYFSKIKRISFLLESAELVHHEMPDFHLILVGQGNQQELVDAAVKKNPWIHHVGAKDDVEKVPYWMISKLLLMPGAVGLVVLDSFALGVPMLTINGVKHGPEISYLEDNLKALSVNTNTPQAFAQEVVVLLRDPKRLEDLREECHQAAGKYSAEIMADNFFSGIQCIINQFTRQQTNPQLIENKR